MTKKQRDNFYKQKEVLSEKLRTTCHKKGCRHMYTCPKSCQCADSIRLNPITAVMWYLALTLGKLRIDNCGIIEDVMRAIGVAQSGIYTLSQHTVRDSKFSHRSRVLLCKVEDLLWRYRYLLIHHKEEADTNEYKP